MSHSRIAAHNCLLAALAYPAPCCAGEQAGGQLPDVLNWLVCPAIVRGSSKRLRGAGTAAPWVSAEGAHVTSYQRLASGLSY